MNSARSPSELPPGQQLVAAGKWPIIGERPPAADARLESFSIGGLVACPREWTVDELGTLGLREFVQDLHCVTRWSKLGVQFRGVLLADLVQQAQPSAAARYVSFTAHSTRQHSTSLPLADCLALEVFLALECDGMALSVEHGGPVRVIVPGRYLYKSLKWLARMELLADDHLGYWEQTAGYHNVADPWRQERYIASQVDRQQLARWLAARDVSGQELLGLQAAHQVLEQLQARGAILRDADFRRARLTGATFEAANLSNAHFEHADLRGASFQQADVEGASFQAADLRGADFRGASLIGASFGETSGTSRLVARWDETTRWDLHAREQLTPEQAHFWDQGRG